MLAEKIRPLNHHILVKRDVEEAVSPGGIILGEKAYDTGRVIAVGPGLKNKKGTRDSMWDIHPGMQIAFSPRGNNKVGDLVMIRRDAVIGEIEEAA